MGTKTPCGTQNGYLDVTMRMEKVKKGDVEGMSKKNNGMQVKGMSEADIRALVKLAAEQGAKAYKDECEQSAKKKVDRMLYRTKTLMEKYRYLKEYANKSVYTLEKAEAVNGGIADIEVLAKFGIYDDDKTLHRLERGVMTVNMLMTHIDNMLEVYRAECESSSNITKQRQWRVIDGLYLAEDRKTCADIADEENEDLRTIQRDAKHAREDLTVLFFGIDGMLVRLLGDK